MTFEKVQLGVLPLAAAGHARCRTVAFMLPPHD